MSKGHQASRRRTYGRRRHELHQRPDLRETGRFAAGGQDERVSTEAVVVMSARGLHDPLAAFGFAD